MLFLAQQTPAPTLEAKQMIARLAEEAEHFYESAGQLIAEETLQQKAIKAVKRFNPRIGASALKEPPPQWQERELKSEFAYALMGAGGNGILHEARQVLNVDGKTVRSADKARQKLMLGLRSGDDETKKKLLEDLEKHGLEGSATDFTLSILIFRPRNLALLDVRPVRSARIGAELAMVFAFRQKSGTEGVTIFQGKKVFRRPMQGEVWLRLSDALPLRLTFDSEIELDDGEILADRGEIDYVRAANGALAPITALHRRKSGERVIAENRFAYSGFRRFAADSEIKFSSEDDPPPAKP